MIYTAQYAVHIFSIHSLQFDNLSDDVPSPSRAADDGRIQYCTCRISPYPIDLSYIGLASSHNLSLP